MNINEIKNEIQMLEEGDTNWANIQKLSWLYIVRNGLEKGPMQGMARGITPECGASDFEIACSGKDICEVIKILDEHMEVMHLLHPKEYQAVIDRINSIAE